jgi:hypothetical protein
VARRFGQPTYELNDALKAVDLFYSSPEMRMKKETFQEATNRVLAGMFEPSMVDESTDGTTAMSNREHYDLLVMKLDGRHVPEAKLA